MPTIYGMATLATAQAAYLLNADYEETNSVAKAKAFCTACRQLVVLLPSSAMRGAGSIQQTIGFHVEEIRHALAEAKAWLAVNDTGENGNPNVIHPDFSFSRD